MSDTPIDPTESAPADAAATAPIAAPGPLSPDQTAPPTVNVSTAPPAYGEAATPAAQANPTFVKTKTKTLWINPQKKLLVLAVSGVAALGLLGVGAIAGSVATRHDDRHMVSFDGNGPMQGGPGYRHMQGKMFGPGQKGRLDGSQVGGGPRMMPYQQAPQGPSGKPAAPSSPEASPSASPNS